VLVVALLMTATAARAAPLQATASTPALEASQVYVDCHRAQMPKVVEQWEKSEHAASGGAACLGCHAAEKDDWDATEHYGNVTIGTHPTPRDCEPCHEQATEFNRSKHAALAMTYFAASFDRNVFEPTIATKHGCQQCHNIGHFWPDGSVGECDACHPKHTFDVAVARNPYTCGECHIGPDHPHIEIWEESKHGNVFLSFPENHYKLGYKTKDYENKPVPFDAPTCTTCHMDAAPGLPATHDKKSGQEWKRSASNATPGIIQNCGAILFDCWSRGFSRSPASANPPEGSTPEFAEYTSERYPAARGILTRRSSCGILRCHGFLPWLIQDPPVRW
jgi:hypothetical protein